MVVIGFSLRVLEHTCPVGLVLGVSFLILRCLSLVLMSGRVEFSTPALNIVQGLYCYNIGQALPMPHI